jgi:hypothetical protein
MAIASPLNIGKSASSLRSVGGAVSGANRTIKNIGGIIFRRTKFKRESIATSKTLTNKRIENENRAEREAELEAPNLTKTPTGASNLANQSGGSFLDRIIGFLGYTTAGWILNNLPTWIGLGKEFIARLQKAGQIISSVASDAINIVGGFGNVLGAVGKNILSFDIFDSSKRLQNAVGDLNATFEDMGKQFNDGFKLVSTPITDKSGKGTYSGANIPPTGTPSPNQGAYPETPTPGNLGPATNLVSGARAIMNAGFPAKGAAYLAGNIQQESGWRGQRDPWVLNDGAGTNKGLVSWNRGRITNAEKFLGKPLNKASNSDQIRWIKQEMQKSYPDAYKIFMNPNASDADLQRASYIYLGYGEVGSRFAYANKAYAALQKGGPTPQPTPAPTQVYTSNKPQNKGNLLSEYITGDPNTPLGRYDKSGHGTTRNYHDHLAFKDKETTLNAYNFFKSKGFKVTELNVSSGHANGSLHYSGRAFDIPGSQWGGSGAIGPKEYQGSAKVRATLAQFLGTSPSLEGAAQVASTPSSQMGQQLTPERTGQNILVFDIGAGQSPPPAAPSGGGGGAPISPDDSTMVNNFIKKKLLLDLVYL